MYLVLDILQGIELHAKFADLGSLLVVGGLVVPKVFIDHPEQRITNWCVDSALHTGPHGQRG